MSFTPNPNDKIVSKAKPINSGFIANPNDKVVKPATPTSLVATPVTPLTTTPVSTPLKVVSPLVKPVATVVTPIVPPKEPTNKPGFFENIVKTLDNPVTKWLVGTMNGPTETFVENLIYKGAKMIFEETKKPSRSLVDTETRTNLNKLDEKPYHSPFFPNMTLPEKTEEQKLDAATKFFTPVVDKNQGIEITNNSFLPTGVNITGNKKTSTEEGELKAYNFIAATGTTYEIDPEFGIPIRNSVPMDDITLKKIRKDALNFKQQKIVDFNNELNVKMNKELSELKEKNKYDSYGSTGAAGFIGTGGVDAVGGSLEELEIVNRYKKLKEENLKTVEGQYQAFVTDYVAPPQYDNMLISKNILGIALPVKEKTVENVDANNKLAISNIDNSINIFKNDKNLYNTLVENGNKSQNLYDPNVEEVVSASINSGQQAADIYNNNLKTVKPLQKITLDGLAYQGLVDQMGVINQTIKSTTAALTKFNKEDVSDLTPEGLKAHNIIGNGIQANLIKLQELKGTMIDWGVKNLAAYTEYQVRQDKVTEFGLKDQTAAVSGSLMEHFGNLPKDIYKGIGSIGMTTGEGNKNYFTQPLATGQKDKSTVPANVVIENLMNQKAYSDIRPQIKQNDVFVNIDKAEAIQLFDKETGKFVGFENMITPTAFFYQAGKVGLESTILGGIGGITEAGVADVGEALIGQTLKNQAASYAAKGGLYRVGDAVISTAITTAKIGNRLTSMVIPTGILYGDQMYTDFREQGFTPEQSKNLTMLSVFFEGGSEAIFGNEIKLYNAFIGKTESTILKKEASVIFDKAIGAKILEATGRPATMAELSLAKKLFIGTKSWLKNTAAPFAKEGIKVGLEESAEEEATGIATALIIEPKQKEYNPSYVEKGFSAEDALTTMVTTMATMLPMMGLAGYHHIQHGKVEALQAKYEVGSAPLIHLENLKNSFDLKQISKEDYEKAVVYVEQYASLKKGIDSAVENAPNLRSFTNIEKENIKLQIFSEQLKKSDIEQQIMVSLTDKQKAALAEQLSAIDDHIANLIENGTYTDIKQRNAAQLFQLDYLFNDKTIPLYNDPIKIGDVMNELEAQQAREIEPKIIAAYDQKINALADRFEEILKERYEAYKKENGIVDEEVTTEEASQEDITDEEIITPETGEEVAPIVTTEVMPHEQLSNDLDNATLENIEDFERQIDDLVDPSLTSEELSNKKQELYTKLFAKQSDLFSPETTKEGVIVPTEGAPEQTPQDLIPSIRETKVDMPIGKVGNTEYEVKADGIEYKGKKLDNPKNLPVKQLITEDIERRKEEELNINAQSIKFDKERIAITSPDFIKKLLYDVRGNTFFVTKIQKSGTSQYNKGFNLWISINGGKEQIVNTAGITDKIISNALKEGFYLFSPKEEIDAKYKEELDALEVKPTTTTTEDKSDNIKNRNRKDLFPDESEFADVIGGSGQNSKISSYKEVNGIGIAEYTNPKNGLVDVIMTGTSDNDYVGYVRIYTKSIVDGKVVTTPSERWTSKMENKSQNKANIKTMLAEVQKLLPAGHEYTEKTNISLEGLKTYAQQLKYGYKILLDKDGKPVVNQIILNKASVSALQNAKSQEEINDLYDSYENLTRAEYNEIKAKINALMPEARVLPFNETKGTINIDLPVLKSTKTVEPTTDNKTDIEAKKAEIERKRQEALQPYDERDARSLEAITPNNPNHPTFKVGMKKNVGDNVIVEKTNTDNWNGEGDGYTVITAIKSPAEFDSEGKMTKAAKIEEGIFNSKEEADAAIQATFEKVKAKIGQKQKEINAKYDAELAALKEQPETKTVDQQIADLRAQEQAEYESMTDPNDKAAKKEIYDRYDKLITPLLKAQEGNKAEQIISEAEQVEQVEKLEAKATEVVNNNNEIEQKRIIIGETNYNPLGSVVPYGKIDQNHFIYLRTQRALFKLRELQAKDPMGFAKKYFATVQKNTDKLLDENSINANLSPEKISNGVIVLITDEKGVPYLFDNDGNISNDGFPIFQNFNSSKTIENENKKKEIDVLLTGEGLGAQYDINSKRVARIREALDKNPTKKITFTIDEITPTENGQKSSERLIFSTKDLVSGQSQTLSQSTSTTQGKVKSTSVQIYTVSVKNSLGVPVEYFANMPKISTISLKQTLQDLLDLTKTEGLPEELQSFSARRELLRSFMFVTHDSEYNKFLQGTKSAPLRYFAVSNNEVRVILRNQNLSLEEWYKSDDYKFLELNENSQFLSNFDFKMYNWDSQTNKFVPTKPQSYKDFILSNITFKGKDITQKVSTIKLDRDVSFKPKEQATEQVEPIIPQESPLTEKPKDEGKKDFKALGDGLDDFTNVPLNRLKILPSRKLTQKQESKATEWFNKYQSKTGVSKEDMTNIVNDVAYAQWYKGAITLFNGSTSADLYHEAFHDFTQLYLTKKQKIDLYNEVAKTKEGQKILNTLKKGATDLEKYHALEELMAEDFKNYMLSDQKLILGERPKRNSIFRKIFNFLKELFTNQPSLETIYKNLANNNIKGQRDFSNAMFGTLNSDIKGLDEEQTQDVYRIIDSVIGDKFRKTGLSIAGFFKDKNKLRAAYNSAHDSILEAYKELENTPENALSITNSEFLLANWNNVRLSHVQNSPLLKLSKEYIKIDEDEFDEEKPEVKGSMYDDDSSKSVREKASAQLIYLIATQPAYLQVGDKQIPKPNAFLPYIQDVEDFNNLWNSIANILNGTLTYDQQYKKLQKEAETNLTFKSLISSLPNPLQKLDGLSAQLRNQFIIMFSQPLIPMKIMNFRFQADGSLNVTANNATVSSINKIKEDWKYNLQSSKNPYATVNYLGRNELDIDKVLEDFVNIGIRPEETKIAFLNALGISFSPKTLRSEDFKTFLSDKDKLKRLYDSLKKIQTSKNDDTLDFRAREKASQPFYDAAISFSSLGDQATLKELADIEVKNGDKYIGDNMLNANGDSTYGIRQYSQQSMMFAYLNDYELYPTYDALINSPIGAVFDITKNPDADNIFLRSLFNLKEGENFGVRYIDKKTNKPVQITLYNHNGLSITSFDELPENGETTLSLSRFLKAVQDISPLLESGEKENLRYGDKVTANGILTTFKREGVLPALNPHIPVDIKDFKNSYLPEQAYSIFKNRLFTTLKRTNDFFVNGTLQDAIAFSTNVNKGDYFGILDGMLSEETKKILSQDIKDKELDISKLLKDNEIIIRKDIANYMEGLVEDYSKELSKNKLIDPSKFVSTFLLNTHGFDTILKAYIANSYILNMEHISMFFQDIRFYTDKNNYKEPFKRFSKACLGHGTKIIMYDGSLKEVQDIVVGDKLMGVDSTPREVLELHSGVDDMYEIQQKRGITYVANSEHLISLKTRYRREKKRIGTGNKRAYIDEYYEKPKDIILNIPVKELILKSKKFFSGNLGWKAKRIDFNNFNYTSEDLPIDPYYMGLWLGDGSSDFPNRIFNIDKEVINYISDYAEKLGLQVIKNRIAYDITCGVKSNRWLKGNTIINEFNKLGLKNNKYIHPLYLYNTRENRLKLLAGLLDSDGYLRPNNSGFVICQVRKMLLKQIIFLAQSLGFIASYSELDATKYNENNQIRYTTNISGVNLNEIPTKIERKKAKPSKCNNDFSVTEISIKPIGIGNYYGFELSGDRLFLLEDLTVTHNTSTGIRLVNDPQINAFLQGTDEELKHYNAVNGTNILERDKSLPKLSAIFNDIGYSENSPELKDLLDMLDKVFKNSSKEDLLNIRKAHIDMKPTDAMASCTFDFYREFSIKSGNDEWSPEKNALYKKIATEQKLTEEETKSAFLFFPPLKLRVVGYTQDKDGNVIPIDYKFAISPLLGTIVKGKGYEVIKDNMLRQQVSLVLFNSASKHSSIGVMKDNKLQQNALYNEDNTPNSGDWVLNPIQQDFIFEVVPSPKTYKGEATFSTQLRKLLFVNSFDNGIPIDYKGTKPFNTLTEAEKIKQSYVYYLDNTIANAIDDLVTLEKNTILNKIGATLNTKTDKYTFDDAKLSAFLEEELSKRNISKNALDTLKVIDGKFKYSLDSSLQRESLEQILLSIIDNKLKKQKSIGESLIQASSIGYENFNKAIKIKPGVEELFESNNNLANQVYEALGFIKNLNKLKVQDMKTKVAENWDTIKSTSKDLRNYIENQFAEKHNLTQEQIDVLKEFVNIGEEDINSNPYVDFENFEDRPDLIKKYNLREKEFGSEWARFKYKFPNLTQKQIVEIGQIEDISGYIAREQKGAFLSEIEGESGLPNNMVDLELSKITPEQKQQALQQYSQYLDTGKKDIEGFKKFLSKPSSKTVMVSSWKNVGGWDLPYYGYEGRTLPDGTKVTSAHKVKIALQGDFKKLLDLKDVKDLANNPDVIKEAKAKGEGYSPEMVALNRLLKDEKWLDKDNHRRLVSLIGVRIPVQGHNSKEFMEVFEFLPTEAGPIVIVSPALVAKSGGDFDWDKVTSSFPSFEVNKEGKAFIYKKVEGLDNPKNNLNNKKALNNIINDAMRKVLERTENIQQLLIPNSTHLLEPLADARKAALTNKKASWSDVASPQESLNQHESNSVGKQSLGILAVANTFFSQLQRAGAYMSKVFRKDLNNPKTRKINHRLSHNKTANGNISLSSIMDALGLNRISDVFSQLINGAVDVAKKDWIFFINGIKEIIPNIAYLNMTGTPVLENIAFHTQPIINDFIETLKNYKSPLVKYTNRKAYNLAKIHAIYETIAKYADIPQTSTKLVPGQKIISKTDIDRFKEYVNKSNSKPKEFFTSDSKFTEFYQDDLGIQRGIPQSSKWFLNDKGYYDLIDQETGEFLIDNVDLATGVQYNEPTEINQPVSSTSALSHYIRDFKEIYEKVLEDPSMAPLFYGYMNNQMTALADKFMGYFEYEKFKDFAIPVDGKLKVPTTQEEKFAQVLYLVQFLEFESQQSTLSSVRTTMNQDTKKPINLQDSNERLLKQKEAQNHEILPREVIKKLVTESTTKAFTSPTQGVDAFISKLLDKIFDVTDHPLFNQFLKDEFDKPHTYNPVKQDRKTKQFYLQTGYSNMPFNVRYDLKEAWIKAVKNDFIEYLAKNNLYLPNDPSTRVSDYFFTNLINYNIGLHVTLDTIKDKFPELLNNNLLLQYLEKDPSRIKVNGVPQYMNLKLKTERIEPVVEKVLIEAFKKLINFSDSNYSVDDQVLIRTFAQDLAYLAFNQSGLNSSKISFTKIIPQELYSEDLTNIIRSFKKLMDENPETAIKEFNTFYKLFKQNNSKFFRANDISELYPQQQENDSPILDINFAKETNRGKNYVTSEAIDLLSKREQALKLIQEKQTQHIKDITAQQVFTSDIAKDNPRNLYVYNSNTDNNNKYQNMSIKVDNNTDYPNTIHIPTYKSFDGNYTDADFSKIKVEIDAQIQNILSYIKQNNPTKVIFPQDILDRLNNAPKIKEYLQQQLNHYFDLSEKTPIFTGETTTNMPSKLEGKMTYSYGSNKREDITSTTTFDAILNGERTATTRYESDGKLDYWKSAKVGDIIKWESNDGRTVDVVVTKALHPLKGSGKNAEQWSKLEGWSKEYFDNKVRPKLDQAWQIEYKLATTITQPSTTKVVPTISVKNFSKKNLFTVTPQQGVSDNKAKAKASIATQYIGFGEGIIGRDGKRSTTQIYREQVGALANTGNYSANDVIFVSIPGLRGNAEIAKREQNKTIKEAIKALEAGATIITDNKDYIDSSAYNTGEQRLYKNMEAKGYNYSEITVDGQVLGIWENNNKPSIEEEDISQEQPESTNIFDEEVVPNNQLDLFADNKTNQENINNDETILNSKEFKEWLSLELENNPNSTVEELLEYYKKCNL